MQAYLMNRPVDWGRITVVPTDRMVPERAPTRQPIDGVILPAPAERQPVRQPILRKLRADHSIGSTINVVSQQKVQETVIPPFAGMTEIPNVHIYWYTGGESNVCGTS